MTPQPLLPSDLCLYPGGEPGRDRKPIPDEVRQALAQFDSGDAYAIVTRSSGGMFVTRMDTAGHIVAAPRKVLDRTGESVVASNGQRIVIAGIEVDVLDMEGNVIAGSLPLPMETTTGGFAFQIASNGLM